MPEIIKKQFSSNLLLLLLAALGLIIFILIATVLPFKDKLFSLLYPKPPSFAETISNDPDPDAPVMNAWVKAILATNDAAYLGGQIIYVGPNTGGGVPISTSTGLRVNPYTRIIGDVNAAIPDGQSGWYIGGWFSFNGLSNSVNLAHILPDGSRDPTFNISTSSAGAEFTSGGERTVWTLALSSDKSTLYVGGEFTIIGGQTRKRLAAVDTATGSVTSFNSGDIKVDWGDRGSVESLALSPDGSILYLGGYFNIVNGQTRNRIAAIETATGNVTTFNPNSDSDVLSMDLSSDGTILYVGGYFDNIGGLARGRVAKIETSSGNAVAAFNAGTPDNDVYSVTLSPDDSPLYVGGVFDNIGGQPRSIVAALDTATGNATSFNTFFTPNGSNFTQAVYLNPAGTTLYVGGWFKTDGPARDQIAAFDTATGNFLDWGPMSIGAIFTFALHSD